MKIVVNVENFEAWLNSEPQTPLKQALKALKTAEKSALRFEIQPMGIGWH